MGDPAPPPVRLVHPEQIEAESFRIIEAEIGAHALPPAEFQIVRRVIHASADFDYARTLAFSPGAVAKGVAALRAGRDIVCDVEMIRAGISKEKLARLGGKVHSFISDPDVADEAKRAGVTRAIASMRKAAGACPGAVYAIGNAPTALLEIVDLAKAGKAAPALVIGVPVGFVQAAEAKEGLIASGIASIACRGRKGGSPVAVAIVNALLRLAEA